MQNGTENKIAGIKFYRCGYCINDLKHMYKEIKTHKKVKFYAKVMLIDHKTHGKILVDTGYSHRIYENGLTSKLYQLLNPAYYQKEDHILYQLKKDGIDQKDLNMVILTHLHPDHTGGLKDISHARMIMSDQCGSRLFRSKYRELIFSNQINKQMKKKPVFLTLSQQSPLKGFMGRDLFHDNSIWLIDLCGHAYGQTGIYIPEKKLFYVADATWGRDYLRYRLRLIPRLIQNHYHSYIQTVKKISCLNDITIISCHGDEDYQNAE